MISDRSLEPSARPRRVRPEGGPRYAAADLGPAGVDDDPDLLDPHEVRSRNRPPTCTDDESLAEVWNRVADPVAPLVGLPGVIWTPVTVDVARTRR